MAKSGNITIKLGPREVKHILEHPSYSGRFGHPSDIIMTKVSKAAAAKFPEVAKGMEEELQARDTCHGMRESPAWRTMLAGFHAERKVINVMYQALNEKESKAMEQLVQQAFNKAGITGFKAHGFGFNPVERDGEL
ncbi:unnamed protein product [marine sediment metagenome]|uniref:Uncharacterized protein n=1 Tax=marine sediment metagenome TaxID=412755 RepID=X1E4N4_9ZZZZ